LQIKTGLLSTVENSVCDIFINIEDTGIGISPDQQKHIFKVFQQENGRDFYATAELPVFPDELK